MAKAAPGAAASESSPEQKANASTASAAAPTAAPAEAPSMVAGTSAGGVGGASTRAEAAHVWREERPVQAPARRRRSPSSNRGKIFLVVAAMLALAGSFTGLLSWVGTIPRPYFLPLWITEYRSRQIPFLPLSRQDFNAIRPYFPNNSGDPLSRQEGHQLLQELDQLQDFAADVDVVVYVHALAIRDGKGEVYILPGDALPSDTPTWIALREILQRLRQCPSNHKLLVLDIMCTAPSRGLGVMYHDIADAIPGELDAVPDPNRLVLCPCSPGQIAHHSPVLGRSVFSHYLERGLKGEAEGYGINQTADGQIWVQELTRFVAARVDRWSRMNRVERQTPVVYGSGGDFPLRALDPGDPGKTDVEVPGIDYPPGFVGFWSMRDHWWNTGGYRVDPRAFQQMQAVLQIAEDDWRGQYDAVRIRDNYLAFFSRLENRLQKSTQRVQPTPVSLAQMRDMGAMPDPALRQIFKNWLDLSRRQLALAKPKEVAALQVKLVHDLETSIKKLSSAPAPGKGGASGSAAPASGGTSGNNGGGGSPSAPSDPTKGASSKDGAAANSSSSSASASSPVNGSSSGDNSAGGASGTIRPAASAAIQSSAAATASKQARASGPPTEFQYEFAIFLVAQEEEASPENLQLLDQALHLPGRPAPKYSETQVIPVLAEMSRQVTAAEPWSTEMARLALDLAQQSEEATSLPEVFPWVQPFVDGITLERHEGEVLMLARGFASQKDASSLLQSASRRYDSVLQQAGDVERAQEMLARALTILPFYRPFLHAEPTFERTWEEAVKATRELATLLRDTPTQRPTNNPDERNRQFLELKEKIAAISIAASRLQTPLKDLEQPFSASNQKRLIDMTGVPQADSETLAAIEAIISLPSPLVNAEQRFAIWKARDKLATQLLEQTLRLDAEDNRLHRQTKAPEPWDSSNAQLREQSLARLRAAFALHLLELGGVGESYLQPIRDAVDLARKNPTVENWCKVGVMFRKMWLSDIARIYDQTPSPQLRRQMLWVLPGLVSYFGVDDSFESVATKLRMDQVRSLWSWLEDHYRYRARDLQGLGLDSPSLLQLRRFLTHAALAHPDLTQVPQEAYVSMNTLSAAPTLTPETSSQAVTLSVQRYFPINSNDVVDITFFRADPYWLKVDPQQAQLPRPSTPVPFAPANVPLTVTLNPAAKSTLFPPPRGFLARASLENKRSFHRIVPVKLQGLTREVEILVSSNAKTPVPPTGDIRLRPGGIAQPYYIYLKNLTTEPKKLDVEVFGNDILLPGGKISVVLAPSSIQRVMLPDTPAPKKGEAPPTFEGPLEIRLREPDAGGPILATAVIGVGIASPREYTRVTDISFDPANASNKGNNKLSVTLQALNAVPGPPIPAGLVLPKDRIPGFRSVGGGTFQGEISNKGKLPPLTLYAEKINVAPSLDDEGPVYVNVDGVPRVFVFRTSFASGLDPATPRGDGRPALRIDTAPYSGAVANFTVPIEVDNAPVDTTLDVALGRFDDGTFYTDLFRTFSAAKNRSVTMTVQNGGLVFQASIQDWQAVFDTRLILGRRTLRARLLDSNGNVFMDAMRDVLIDGNPPSLVRFLSPPAQAMKGTNLKLQIQTVDNESGIAKVDFFLGRPQNNKLPANVQTMPGNPADPALNTWGAEIPLPPDGKGPTPISVRVENNVGLDLFGTVVIDLIDTEPGTTGPGKIAGKVFEGPLPQPGLEVVLRNAKGKEQAKTKTKADGSFVFDNLKPGEYSLFCLKPSTLRRATMKVVVEPNKTTPASLALNL